MPRLSDVATAASPELDALLSRLLSKEPAERIGYAADVDDALAALGVPAPEQDVPARPYLYRPALVGREPILETVAGRIQRIEHGEAGGIVFLSGETGSGKTRLLIEAARMAMDRGLTVLRGGSAASAPLSLLADAIRRALEIARASGDAPSPADPVVAALAAYLPSLDGVKRAPELPEEGARLRLFAAISRSLEAAARRKPVVLLLDGLDQADELTLGWLSQEARTGPRERLLVAGTLCTTTSAPAELTALARSTHVTVLPLGPYDATEVERLIGSMLACREVPEGLAGLLAERSGGNPFFVAEYLRLAVAQGVLTRDAGTWVVAPSASARRTLSAYGALPAPRSLHDLSVERVRALQPAAAEILGVVAILGPDANREILAAVGCDPSVVQAAVHELVSRDVAIESAGTLRAAHPAMGDAAASLLPADLRRGVHQRAALALGTPEDPAKLGRVARHWAEAGEAARARACYRSAATGEIERLALAEGVELLRRFLELSPGPCLEDLDARDELGRTLRHSGRSAEAVDVLRVALDDARRIGVPARESHTSRGLANALRQLGKVEEALALCRSALALARQAGALTEEAAALATLGTVLSDLGRNVEARELLREALARHRASGDPRTIANSARTLGTIAFESG
ncbi:MAG: tetratricopeptide repeat protein, partial [Acidobacteriota bacterium]